MSLDMTYKIIPKRHHLDIMMSFLKAVNPKTNCFICDIRLSDNLPTKYILSTQ